MQKRKLSLLALVHLSVRPAVSGSQRRPAGRCDFTPQPRLQSALRWLPVAGQEVFISKCDGSNPSCLSPINLGQLVCGSLARCRVCFLLSVCWEGSSELWSTCCTDAQQTNCGTGGTLSGGLVRQNPPLTCPHLEVTSFILLHS